MIWSFLFWVLLVLGLIVGVRAWLWDRAGFRGRAKRRCRKCWYDLTGAVECDDGYVCPECGKRHRTIRSMRKTRRSWRLVVVAVVLIAGAYFVRATPAVQKRGVWAAVPSWVLILGIHQTPNFVQDADVEWGSIAYGDKSPLERAMRELHVRARVEGLSWFDYQLVAWLARTEGRDGLCVVSHGRKNGVHPRAASYKILFENGIRRGKLGEFHSRWIRRLVRVDVETRSAWPAGGRVFGKPQIVNALSIRMKDPQLRVRFYDPYHGTSIFPPTWNDPPYRLQELNGRAMRYFEQRNGTPVSIAGGVWNDGMIELKPRDPSDNFADLQVTVSELLGEWDSLDQPETIVDRYELSVPVHRVDSIESIASVVSDQDVVAEIERCVRAEGFWWYDIDGCRRVVLVLRLRESPTLPRKRYTFGDDRISVYSGHDGLQGHGWWALEPDGELGWRLVHGGKLVLMSGGGSEKSFSRTDYPWTVSIRSDPEFCLRDFDATHILSGRLRFDVTWTQMPKDGV